MQSRKIIFLLLAVFISRSILAQDSLTIVQYINTYKNIAIEEMQRTGAPASIILAQGIHETLAGTSDLVKKSNNHFGIKCKDNWTGESVKHNDDLRNECFRKYKSAEESYRDHSDFLKNSPRYSPLFNLAPTDYKDWALGLKRAGYATNPKYAQILIKLIEDYHLQDYSLIALGKMSPKQEILAKTNVDKTGKQDEFVAAASKTIEPVFIEEKKIGPIKPEIKSQETKDPVTKAQPKLVLQKPLYPEGEFKINETRVVYVKKGTPFLGIAQQYNISLAWLFDFNDMKEMEAATKDQLIYLQRKRKIGNNEFHIVKPGETLYDIAQKEAIRLESLLEYNRLDNDMQPANGVKLYLRTKASVTPRLISKDNNTSNETQDALVINPIIKSNTENTNLTAEKNDRLISYVVLPKETIYSIARKYQVKIDDLAKWNQLSNYELKIGQSLKIYK